MMKLTDIERESPLWDKIVQQAKETVVALHLRLEHAKTWDEVLKIQGELRAVRGLLNANNVPVVMERDTIGF